MKKLSIIDDLFLRYEDRRKPLHVGVLMLFEPQGESPKDFVTRLAERFHNSNTAATPFDLRLVTKRGIHDWKKSEDFNLANHVVHVALPRPGRIRELLSLISRVHSSHLDRAYPLWQLYLIEGIEGDRFAVYIKIHHALMDGVSGIKLLINSMSTDLESSYNLPPPWQVNTRKSSVHHLPVVSRSRSISALRSFAREHVKSVLPLMREINSNLRDLWNKNPNFVVAGQAPRTIFNHKVSTARRIAAQSYSTPRIRAVANAYGSTVNDVVLAMCSGALRRYLLSMNALPDRSLVAAVPVSLRRENSESLSNEVSFTFTTLATHLEDPHQRMCAIKNCMDYNKEHLRKLSPDQSMISSVLKLLPAALNNLPGFSSDSVEGNVVISHIPGPNRPLYWQGAKLCGLYPVSLVIDKGALNITLISRHDFVDFGIIACSKSVPHVQRLLEYLEESLVELEATVSAEPGVVDLETAQA